MKRTLSTRQLVYLAVCIALSLVSKRLISPITNIVTDFVRLPGGGAAAAFSLMFLVLGSADIVWPFAGTFSATIQGFLALCFGMSGYQGIMMLLTYAAPGLVIDLMRGILPHRGRMYYIMTNTAANFLSAFISNMLVFRLEGPALLLWMLIACWFGMIAGFIAGELRDRIEAGFKRSVLCSEKI